MKTARNGFIIIALGLASVGGSFAQGPQGEHAPGRLLVQTVPGVNDAVAGQAFAMAGAKVHHTINQIGVTVLEVPEPALDAVSQALQRTGKFTFVERDFVAHAGATPNDPDFASQWHLSTIQAPSAWNITTGSASAPIAIIDSGADPTHPDLASKLLPGWNFLTGTSNTSDTGANGGHGTAIAGAAAAATNNFTGVAGVSWANPILPLVVLDSSDYALYSDIASAMTYAADHGARIANVSIGGPTASSTLQSAVDYAWSKGTVIFAAAMNNSSSTPYYPAACNNVVSISATEPNDTFASFSNYGNWIDLSAPGDSIVTTQLGGGYGSWWGTSLATPIAATVGALALAENPKLSAAALVTLLEQNSDDLGTPGYDLYYGWGRVNAYKAVLAAKNPTGDTTPPTVSITAPLFGATVSGTILVQGSATDNVGVTGIELDVDGAAVATTTVSPFAFSWNTTASANGSHTLTVKAYDAANNVSSVSVSVTVSNLSNTVVPPPTAGLIGYWNFDEDSGSIAHDTSGSGYNATLTGAVWTTGKINSGLSFNGSTNYGVTPNIALGNTFSISTWASPAVTSQGGYVRILETQFNGGLYLGMDASGSKYKFIVNSGTGSSGSCGAAYGCAQGGTVTSGWHLLTATFDGATATLYVDNAVVATDTFTAPANTNYPLYIARYYGGNGYSWNGALDEIRLYNRALTSAEVSAIYSYTGSPPDTTPPSTPANVSALAVSSSQINVSWAASTDNVGVAGYQVFRNSALIKTTTALSYSDTGLAASTTYSYTVAAFDAAGNTSPQSAPVSATTLTPDTTPPTVSITAPVGGSTVSNTVTVSASASDNVAVADVQFQLDGVNLGQGLTTAPYTISWDTTTTSNGAHNLTAIARDTSHNSTTSAAIAVTVSNTAGSIPTAGLIGYWNFDENSGSIAHDTSGSGYNATLTGAVWTTGKINSGLSFNGSTNYGVTPNIALGNTFSISTWVSPTVTSQGGYVRILETQYYGGMYLGMDASGSKYKFIVNNGAGSSGSCGAAFGCAQGGTVTSGWHLLTATFDGATATLYVDNAVVATDTFTAPANTNYPLYIARYYGGNGYNWNGAMDEVRLYNRALTSAEVSAIYNH